jgi:hypothetical protein
MTAAYNFDGVLYSGATFQLLQGNADELTQSGGFLSGHAISGSGEVAAMWMGESLGSDQFARLTFYAHTAPTACYMGPAVRMSAGTGGTGNYYAFGYDNAATFMHIVRVDNGTPTPLATTTQALLPGDVMELRAVGANLTCWINGVEVVALRVTDSTYASGRIGIRGRNTISNQQFDAFYGDTYGALKIARILCMQGQSVMNGNGYGTDVTSAIPNQSVGYNGWYLRHPYVRPWTAGQVVVSGEVKHSNGYEYEAAAGGTTGATAPSHTSGSVSDGTVTWIYRRAAGAVVSTTYPGAVPVAIGDLLITSANRVYQVCNNGTLSATEPTSTATTGINSDTARLRYLGTTTEVLRVNAVYNRVKIFHNTAERFQSFAIPTTSATATSGNGLDSDNVRIYMGPQIPFAAHMLNRWDDDNSFIVKHAVDGMTLAYVPSLNNYSIQSYDANTLTLLRNFMNSVSAAMAVLLGTSVSAWTTNSNITTAGMMRKNAGNVYQALNAATTGATAPTHTSGNGSDGAVTWRYLHPVYDGVTFVGLAQEHGAQDTTETAYAYSYRFNELNLWRRFNQRWGFADGSGVYVGYVEPFTPRGDNTSTGSLYKTEFAQGLVKPDIRAALLDYANTENGSAVTVTDATNHILYGNRAAWIRTWDLFTSPYYLRSNNELHYQVAGHEAFVNRWWAAYDAQAPLMRAFGGTETTSFYGGGSRPTLTESGSAATVYNVGDSVTVTVTASINGGSTSGIEWYWGHDTSTIIGTGLSVTFTPNFYNGRVLRARVRDPNGYWAHFYKFIYVRAPMTALNAYLTANTLTPRHLIRGNIGAGGVTANGRFDYIANDTGGEASIYAVQSTGAAYSNLHHDGIAMTSAVALRFNTATTDGAGTQPAAALDTAANANFTRFFKGKVNWRQPNTVNLYGAARFASGSGVNGGSVGIPASAISNTGDDQDMALSARHASGSTQVVAFTTTPNYDGGEQMIWAMIKNGSDRKIRARLPNGTFFEQNLSTTATDATGYPDVIGLQGLTVPGFEGLLQGVVGINAHAITDNAVLDAIMSEMAANEPAPAAAGNPHYYYAQL